MSYLLKPAFATAALLLFLSASAASSFAMVQMQSAPDDTAQNKAHNTTADSQSNASEDRHTTAQIRKAIMADKSLSTYAHNVKIITVNGAVTLKGPVQTEDEKQKVASDAASVVTADKVSNELTVKQ